MTPVRFFPRRYKIVFNDFKMEPGRGSIRLIENPERRAQTMRAFLTFPGFPAAPPRR